MTDPISPLFDDDELMRRVSEDSTEALEALMERWQRPVYRFAWRGIHDEGAAEEITQETFWRLWRARRQYRPGGTFSSWLFRIAARLCLDHQRSRSRRPLVQNEEAILAVPAPARDHADRPAREAEMAAALERALGRLPLNQRLALELNRFEALSTRQIAEALGCSVGSVEQLIYRARRRLRQELAEYLGPPPAGLGDEKSAT
jgi:RNA polymerase sigma-70 factor (ECF subfamily)